MLTTLMPNRFRARHLPHVQPKGIHSHLHPSAPIPHLLSTIRAGFPSPANDYVEAVLSPTEYLVKNPSATFFMVMQGDALAEAGILHNDILVIDRSRAAHPGDVVIATVDGEFLARILGRGISGYPCLQVANGRQADPIITDEGDLEIWGKVIGVMRKLK